MSTQSLVAGLFVLGVLGVACRAGAAEALEAAPRAAAVPTARPWVLTVQMSALGIRGPEFATVGLGLERRLSRHFVVDSSVGLGMTGEVETELAGPGLTPEISHVVPSLDLAAHLRAQLPIDARAIHSLFLGVGPHLDAGGPYGSLWHGQVEGGYALRSASGFSLLGGLGAEIALNSQAAPAPSSCYRAGCLPAVAVGDVSTFVRLGVGYSF
jgi:hypothetical protein